MTIKTKSFHDLADLKAHLKTHEPTFYTSSKTSTVIPYDKLSEEIQATLTLGDLSKIAPQMSMKGDNLVLSGAVNWQDADQYLKSQGRAIMTSPTEQLALILAGVATSCTGERCFAFGNLRKQIVQVKYLNHEGDEVELHRSRPFPSIESLKSYQTAFTPYALFKNAPFPRFETETDLMIGTEGQLGIVTELELETTANENVTYVFMLLPRWEEDTSAHLEIFENVQAYRGSVISCELLDANCMSFLKPEERIGSNQDIILMEIKADQFEEVFDKLLSQLTHTSIEDVYEVSGQKFHQIRAGVPRAVFEENSRMGVKKMGTDCQVKGEDFSKLFDFYRQAAKIGVRYNLFGHFGDAHLHFNFMPNPAESAKCQAEFEKLYQKVYEWRGSPFAEHGIGLLKLKFIKNFLTDDQRNVFKELKRIHDPYNQFFPQGFMLNV